MCAHSSQAARCKKFDIPRSHIPTSGRSCTLNGRQLELNTRYHLCTALDGPAELQRFQPAQEARRNLSRPESIGRQGDLRDWPRRPESSRLHVLPRRSWTGQRCAYSNRRPTRRLPCQAIGGGPAHRRPTRRQPDESRCALAAP